MADKRPREATDVRGHILIVDDEEFIRSSFQLYFETLGYRVSVAEGGETALAIFERHHPDVVLLDLVLPGMHGIEILKAMREMDPSSQVIIATGCGSMNTAIQALRYGAYDYITKPIVNFDQDLRKVVEEAMSERQSTCCQPKAAPRNDRKEAASTPDDAASRLLDALEKVALMGSPHQPRPERFRAIATTLADQFGALGVLLLSRGAAGDVRRLDAWVQAGLGDLRRIDAAASSKAALKESKWEEVDEADPGRPRLQALALPLGPEEVHDEPREGFLVLVRLSGPGPAGVSTPCLIALAAARALGFRGRSADAVGVVRAGSRADSA